MTTILKAAEIEMLREVEEYLNYLELRIKYYNEHIDLKEVEKLRSLVGTIVEGLESYAI